MDKWVSGKMGAIMGSKPKQHLKQLFRNGLKNLPSILKIELFFFLSHESLGILRQRQGKACVLLTHRLISVSGVLLGLKGAHTSCGDLAKIHIPTQ